MTFVHAIFLLVTFVHINNIWPNFNQNFGTQFLGSTFFWTTIVLDPNFWDPKLFWPKMILSLKFLMDPIFLDQNYFGSKILFQHNFFDPKFFLTQIFRTQHFLNTYFFGHKISVHPNFAGWFFMIQSKYNKQNNIIFLGFNSIEINLVIFLNFTGLSCFKEELLCETTQKGVKEGAKSSISSLIVLFWLIIQEN